MKQALGFFLTGTILILGNEDVESTQKRQLAWRQAVLQKKRFGITSAGKIKLNFIGSGMLFPCGARNDHDAQFLSIQEACRNRKFKFTIKRNTCMDICPRKDSFNNSILRLRCYFQSRNGIMLKVFHPHYCICHLRNLSTT